MLLLVQDDTALLGQLLLDEDATLDAILFETLLSLSIKLKDSVLLQAEPSLVQVEELISDDDMLETLAKELICEDDESTEDELSMLLVYMLEKYVLVMLGEEESTVDELIRLENIDESEDEMLAEESMLLLATGDDEDRATLELDPASEEEEISIMEDELPVELRVPDQLPVQLLRDEDEDELGALDVALGDNEDEAASGLQVALWEEDEAASEPEAALDEEGETVMEDELSVELYVLDQLPVQLLDGDDAKLGELDAGVEEAGAELDELHPAEDVIVEVSDELVAIAVLLE
jgi:hypothetical protein